MKITSKTSNNYHTFNKLYNHKIALFILLCNFIYEGYGKPKGAEGIMIPWKSKKHSDGTNWDGWFVAGIGFEKGHQITYHLPVDKWDQLKVQELKKAPEWDGHTSKDVINRLYSLTQNEGESL